MTDLSLKLRTQDEIAERVRAYEMGAEDFFGFAREVLIEALDYEHAKPYLKAESTAESWGEPATANEQYEAAVEYYEFALGKIEDHRGISASRSVTKLTEYAWLLCRDDVTEAMNAANFPQYGAPKVKAFADGFGLPWPDDEIFARMAAGEPCTDDCMAGCGS